MVDQIVGEADDSILQFDSHGVRGSAVEDCEYRCGRNGWRDRQLRDGTVVWTAPAGHTYVKYPGSMHLFPRLCAPTATLWTGEPPTVEPNSQRGAMMPKRRRSRADNGARARAAERRLNDAIVAERGKPSPF